MIFLDVFNFQKKIKNSLIITTFLLMVHVVSQKYVMIFFHFICFDNQIWLKYLMVDKRFGYIKKLEK
jgi:hypothetical protein